MDLRLASALVKLEHSTGRATEIADHPAEVRMAVDPGEFVGWVPTVGWVNARGGRR